MKNNFQSKTLFDLNNRISKRTISTIECITALEAITTDLTPLLTQFGNFINQFNHHLASYDILVINDASGHDISIMNNHDADTEKLIVTKYKILDGILQDRTDKIETLLAKGKNLFSTIKVEQPDYTSNILSQAEEFKRLKTNFKG